MRNGAKLVFGLGLAGQFDSVVIAGRAFAPVGGGGGALVSSHSTQVGQEQ